MKSTQCIVSTLLFVFNEQDQVLLQCRRRPPHQGQWSPPGGKCHLSQGESPHQCAAREATEELSIHALPEQFHLTGMVTEQSQDEAPHWWMYLFEYRLRLKHCPPDHAEGHYQWFDRGTVSSLEIPQTDRTFIWPLFWQHRNGWFVTQCQTHSGKVTQWQTLESMPSHNESHPS